MWKVIKINFYVTIFLLIFIEVILITLNFIFDGVPLYKHFNITRDQVITYKQKKYKENKLNILDKFYLDSFKNKTKEKYLKEYIDTNDVSPNSIRWIKGVDINFPIYFDLNNCRENKNDNYLFSDTVLIGDSSLFGIAIASPFDITGRLRHLNKDKKFLNLGIPGSGPMGQVNHLKKVTKETNFENLVWFFVEANDYHDFLPSADCAYYNLEPSSLYSEKIYKPETFLSLKIFFAEHFRGLASFSKLFISYDDKFNLDKNFYEEATKQLKTFLDDKNVKNKYLYYLPYYNRHSYKDEFLIHPNVKKLNVLKDNVKEIVTKYGFIFIDGNDAVKGIKNKKNLYHYGYQTHYNAKGYTLTADHLSRILNSKQN